MANLLTYNYLSSNAESRAGYNFMGATGSITGTPTYSMVNFHDGVRGGDSMIHDYVTLPKAMPGNKGTVEFWINQTHTMAAGAYALFFEGYDAYFEPGKPAFIVGEFAGTDPGIIIFNAVAANGGYVDYRGAFPKDVGDTYHFALAWDFSKGPGQKVKAYVNGVDLLWTPFPGRDAAGLNVPARGTLNVPKNAGGEYWEAMGYVENIKVWDDMIDTFDLVNQLPMPVYTPTAPIPSESFNEQVLEKLEERYTKLFGEPIYPQPYVATNAPSGLVVANHLSSVEEIANGYGPIPTIVGPVGYEPSKFTDGYISKSGYPGGLSYTANMQNAFKDRGTFSCWFTPKYPNPVPFSAGYYLFFAGDIQCWWGDGFTGTGGLELQIGYGNNTWPGCGEPAQWVATPFQSYHLAWCWDRDGIPGLGGATTAIFRDNILVASADNSANLWGSSNATYPVVMGAGADGQYDRYITSDMQMYDYAKTTFDLTSPITIPFSKVVTPNQLTIEEKILYLLKKLGGQ